MAADGLNVIVNLSGKGLMVVPGCSHPGAVAVLRHDRSLTGEQRMV